MAMKILVIDSDNSAWFRHWAKELVGKAVVIPASSMEEAQIQLNANDDVVAIAAVSRIGAEEIDLFALAKCAQENFDGPIILVANDARACNRFVGRGGQHHCDRLDLPQTLLRVLA